MADTEYQPLDGDPDLLASKARHYQAIAEAIARSRHSLEKIHSTDDMKSEALDALRDTADTVGTDIDKAHDRYEKTASALLTYASALRTAQADARRAIADIDAAQSEVDRTQQVAQSAWLDVQFAGNGPDPDPDAQDQARRDLRRANDHASAAVHTRDAAQQRWRDAREAKNAAAEVAYDAIVEVVDKHNNGLKNPSWWEDALSWLHDALKIVCDIAGVLAIFLAWVPGLGEVLIVLAAVGALLDVLDAVIATINGTGNGWGIVFAVGTAALTLFGGKIFSFAAKELHAGALLRSGVKDAKGLSKLQGVGRHGKGFMSLEAAQKQAAKPLHTMFTSPFVRTEAQKTAMDAFKAGTKSRGELIKDALKEAFPITKFDSRKALGINEDLSVFNRMVAEHPELLTKDMKILGMTADMYQGMSSAQKIINLPGKLIGDPTGVVFSGYDGSWGSAYSGTKSSLGDLGLIPDMIERTPHVFGFGD